MIELCRKSSALGQVAAADHDVSSAGLPYLGRRGPSGRTITADDAESEAFIHSSGFGEPLLLGVIGHFPRSANSPPSLASRVPTTSPI